MTGSETKTVTTKFKHPKATLQKKKGGAFPLSRWDPNWRKPDTMLWRGNNALTCRETGNYQTPNSPLRRAGEGSRGTGPHPAPSVSGHKPAWASSGSALSPVHLSCLDHVSLHEELGNNNSNYYRIKSNVPAAGTELEEVHRAPDRRQG